MEEVKKLSTSAVPKSSPSIYIYTVVFLTLLQVCGKHPRASSGLKKNHFLGFIPRAHTVPVY